MSVGGGTAKSNRAFKSDAAENKKSLYINQYNIADHTWIAPGVRSQHNRFSNNGSDDIMLILQSVLFKYILWILTNYANQSGIMTPDSLGTRSNMIAVTVKKLGNLFVYVVENYTGIFRHSLPNLAFYISNIAYKQDH